MSVALWCVLVAGLLPYLASALAKFPNRKNYDNHNPRAWLAGQTGMAARANAAQANSFEAFPFFAAAVLVATLAHAPQSRIDVLSLIFVGARMVYIACYIADKPSLRSLVWLIGMVSLVGIFVAAA
ncbi:MAG TPA: hypothetical protein HPP80_04715 [Rhodospirillaceae bacterium]|nr:hypothetical protein [Rhodospirillaceae bacterium]